MEKNSYNFLLAVLTGLFAALALSPPGWSWFMWLAFVPLFFAIRDSKYAFWKGFLSGFVYFLIIFRWFLSLNLEGMVGITTPVVHWGLIMFVWICSSVAMAAWWGISTKLSSKRLLLFPFVFTISEYMRSVTFSLFWYGSGAITGPHWTMGNIAYAFANNKTLLLLASLGGLYLATLLVASINVLLARILMHHSWKHMVLLGLSLIFLYAPLSMNALSRKSTLNVGIVQTHQESKVSPVSSEIYSYFNTQLSIVKTISSRGQNDVVVFPEASGFLQNLLTFVGTDDLKSYLESMFPQSTLLVTGQRAPVFDAFSSRVYVVDSARGIVSTYDKQLLTPGGEYIPFLIRPAASVFLDKATAFTSSRGLIPGRPQAVVALTLSGIPISTIVCSEIFSPLLVRSVSSRADVVLVETSFSVFSGNSAIIAQTLAAAQFRAAELGKPLVLAANMGISAIIDSHGAILNKTDNNLAQELIGSVDIPEHKSWYTFLGDWPLFFLLLCALALFRPTIQE